MSNHGGFENLIVYWLAIDISDLTVIFCSRYIDKKSRTLDQMVQAARSGKQNIVEGSLENSTESNIKLTGVARASYGELLEDYRDYLRQNHLVIWSKYDLRVLEIRRMKIDTYRTHESYKTDMPNGAQLANRSNLTHMTYMPYLSNSESFANLMITLCFKEGYLLDQLLRSINQKFIREGGFRENLFKKRIAYKNTHSFLINLLIRDEG